MPLRPAVAPSVGRTMNNPSTPTARLRRSSAVVAEAANGGADEDFAAVAALVTVG